MHHLIHLIYFWPRSFQEQLIASPSNMIIHLLNIKLTNYTTRIVLQHKSIASLAMSIPSKIYLPYTKAFWNLEITFLTNWPTLQLEAYTTHLPAYIFCLNICGQVLRLIQKFNGIILALLHIVLFLLNKNKIKLRMNTFND